jgi:hypothetical protein
LLTGICGKEEGEMALFSEQGCVIAHRTSRDYLLLPVTDDRLTAGITSNQICSFIVLWVMSEGNGAKLW